MSRVDWNGPHGMAVRNAFADMVEQAGLSTEEILGELAAFFAMNIQFVHGFTKSAWVVDGKAFTPAMKAEDCEPFAYRITFVSQPIANKTEAPN
jgi:hypothetical protein